LGNDRLDKLYGKVRVYGLGFRETQTHLDLGNDRLDKLYGNVRVYGLGFRVKV
jgi:hypothetical protein